MQKAEEDATKERIVALYLYDQYTSPRCWRTVKDAKHFYARLKSETARLAGVKEQILIRYLGLGWEDAHHPWSSEGHTYTSKTTS